MRALKVLVVVMGVMIGAGTVTLVVLIVQRAGGLASSSGVARMELALDQPVGSRIAGIAAIEAGGTAGLAIWVQRPDGTEAVLLLDTRRGRIAGEVRPAGAAGISSR